MGPMAACVAVNAAFGCLEHLSQILFAKFLQLDQYFDFFDISRIIQELGLFFD